MRTIKLKDCSYERYNAIRNAIIEVIPFALLNQGYSADLKEGFFNFWDSDYIPDELKEFILQPPLSRENKELLKEKLLEAFKLGK